MGIFEKISNALRKAVKFDNLERKVDWLESRIIELDSKRFDNLERKVDWLESRIIELESNIIREHRSARDEIFKRLKVLEDREPIEVLAKFTNLQSRVDNFNMSVMDLGRQFMKATIGIDELEQRINRKLNILALAELKYKAELKSKPNEEKKC